MRTRSRPGTERPPSSCWPCPARSERARPPGRTPLPALRPAEALCARSLREAARAPLLPPATAWSSSTVSSSVVVGLPARHVDRRVVLVELRHAVRDPDLPFPPGYETRTGDHVVARPRLLGVGTDRADALLRKRQRDIELLRAGELASVLRVGQVNVHRIHPGGRGIDGHLKLQRPERLRCGKRSA